MKKEELPTVEVSISVYLIRVLLSVQLCIQIINTTVCIMLTQRWVLKVVITDLQCSNWNIRTTFIATVFTVSLHWNRNVKTKWFVKPPWPPNIKRHFHLINKGASDFSSLSTYINAADTILIKKQAQHNHFNVPNYSDCLHFQSDCIPAIHNHQLNFVKKFLIAWINELESILLCWRQFSFTLTIYLYVQRVLTSWCNQNSEEVWPTAAWSRGLDSYVIKEQNLGISLLKFWL